MNKWNVLISESARKEFYDLDKKGQKRVREAFFELKENPFNSRSKADIRKLQGSFNPVFYRMRVGRYRIVYTVSDSEVKITRIISRGKGYGWL